jgi:hypothetical protein
VVHGAAPRALVLWCFFVLCFHKICRTVRPANPYPPQRELLMVDPAGGQGPLTLVVLGLLVGIPTSGWLWLDGCLHSTHLQ